MNPLTSSRRTIPAAPGVLNLHANPVFNHYRASVRDTLSWRGAARMGPIEERTLEQLLLRRRYPLRQAQTGCRAGTSRADV